MNGDLIKDNKTVLMPINTGHAHWVSMMIRIIQIR
ncbi:MAG: Ulp1 family isopeptidase [Rickettsia endosymbiont of Ixodes persulcatus]|nr:Ulp1 family isopeptidase [Rickettsia endosymbiont of Ixodes persulcatus]